MVMMLSLVKETDMQSMTKFGNKESALRSWKRRTREVNTLEGHGPTGHGEA
jgi:hypothetical protein